ncbi:MAG: thioredoxin family protein [Bacteroidia bacterium]|nr:thioredoxin family protein [Bacteroidia bacterium]
MIKLQISACSKGIIGIVLFFIITSCTPKIKSLTAQKLENETIWIGKIQKKNLLNNKLFPWFQPAYSQFKIEHIDSIKRDNWKASIVAGTWCSDTQRELPKWIKILEARNIPLSNVQIILVDHSKSNPWFYSWAADITSIPAILFYSNGKEIGRLIEQTGDKTEHEFDSILRLGQIP